MAAEKKVFLSEDYHCLRDRLNLLNNQQSAGSPPELYPIENKRLQCLSCEKRGIQSFLVLELDVKDKKIYRCRQENCRDEYIEYPGDQ